MFAGIGEEECENAEEFSDDDEDSEEEEEPKLKYERISGDLREILKKDGASCIAVNSKLLIIGTNWGRVHVLDHLGNKIKQFAPHSRPVTMIDMDDSGDYISSCSHDKKVVVQGLYTTDNSQSLIMETPVRCVALDPQYGKARSGRRFIVGDHQVSLYEKAMFGQLKTTILSVNGGTNGASASGGTVRGMKWGGQFLAWATDSNVRVMDMLTKTIISVIKRDHSLALGCEQYPPHICWQDERTLLIGWGDSVKVCRVQERTPPQPTLLTNSGGGDLPPYYVQIIYMFNTDFYICGIGPLEKLVVVLAYNKNPDIQQQAGGEEQVKDDRSRSGVEWRRPQMRVLDPLQGNYEEVSKDVLGIRCYQEYRPVNYHLAHLAEEKRFYIVCPQDVVVAKPRDADDRVQWLLQNRKYPEALEVVELFASEVQQYSLLGVGRAYLDHLMETADYQAAAQLCPKILGEDKTLWEEAVVRFNRVHQLRVLSPHLPQGPPGPLLDPPVYQTVLLDLLHFDHQGFLQVVQEWPGSLYNVSLIINAVLEELARNTNNLVLLRALAHLYSNIDKHDKALAIYLKLRHTDVFGLISRHSLYGCVAKHVMELLTLDSGVTLAICSQHIDKIHPDDVIAVLNPHPQFLYQYLDKLYEDHRDISAKHHNKMVVLYADYAPTKLMPLLLSSSAFDLKSALDVVKARKLNQETVYLLVRMGNSTEALNLVLHEEQDIKWAMRLCEEHSDPDLWAALISHSLDKPEYIRELLNNMGAHVDPLLIIQCIPHGLQITGLRDALTKIMHDYQLRYSLQSGYQKILVRDGINLLEKQVSNQNSGIPVNNDMSCAACTKKVLGSSMLAREPELVVFYCRHIYHKGCLPDATNIQLAGQILCQVCHNNQKKIFNFA